MEEEFDFAALIETAGQQEEEDPFGIGVLKTEKEILRSLRAELGDDETESVKSSIGTTIADIPTEGHHFTAGRRLSAHERGNEDSSV